MSEQRSAPDVLARRLDQALPAGKTFIPPVTPDPLVNTAAEIAKLRLPTLSTEASARIQTQMLAAYEQQFHPHIVELERPRPRRQMAEVLRWGLVASFVLVMLLVGLTPAVGASVPGDPLYSVKQFYETVELAAANSSGAKAGVYLTRAERRTQEALTLLERDQFDPALVTSALLNIKAAGQSENDVRGSARLRGQLLQVETGLDFVLLNAEQTGLATRTDIAQLTQQLREIRDDNLLLPLLTPTVTPTPTATAEPTETPDVTPTSGTPDITATCDSPGKSCESQGIPGGRITPHPTNTPRSTNTPRPLNTHVPPTSQSNGNSGNSQGNGNSGGGGGQGGGNSGGHGNSGGGN